MNSMVQLMPLRPYHLSLH